ncbi:hypothetical protein BJP36_35540 [Moorena producens JHB]|uniref:Uncharacterized protein n=1 Tax=Moorena producens (strain JHB) TaxID=1454205 RepID=A0A9Q9UW24_MOOP1|nr:hypothetical protein [Moorena producens]WAN69406.1 hypothetical protein BJP36_35540 [Moorena producens JHB]
MATPLLFIPPLSNALIRDTLIAYIQLTKLSEYGLLPLLLACLLLACLLPIPCSLLPTPYSLLLQEVP